MSNLTDGKNALAAGDFATAEIKLGKALDTHPDDGELEEKLFAEFTDAARKGAPEPPLPFNDAYCQNALRYEKGTKRRDFVQSLVGRLDGIWIAARGRSIKSVRMPKRSAPKARKKRDVKSILTYALSSAALVAGLAGFALSYAFGNRPALIASIVIVFGAVGVLTAALMKKSRENRGKENRASEKTRAPEKAQKQKRAPREFDDDFD